MTTVDLTFKSADGFELRGTLETPTGQKGPAPLVVMHPGSGPTDKDGNQPQYKLITNLLPQVAAELHKHGVATFRFDKRASWANGKSWPKDRSGMNHFFGWENHLNDYVAAVEAGRHAPGINPKRVALLGHSEGGTLTLAIAERVKPVALILMGTPGRQYDVLIHEQIAAMLDKQTQDPAVKKMYLDEVDVNCKLIKEEMRVADKVSPGLQALFNPYVTDLLQGTMRFDPLAAARRFSGPVLVVNGASDAQINPDRDARPLSKCFRALKGLVIVPDASHNLKHVGSPAEPGFEGPVDPAALKAIGDFADSSLSGR